MLLLLSKEDYWFLAFYPVLNSLTFLRIFWKFWGKEIHTTLRFSKYQRSPQWRQLIKKLSIICCISEHGKAWFMYLTLWRLELACPDDDYDLGGTLSRNGPFWRGKEPWSQPLLSLSSSSSLHTEWLGVLWRPFSHLENPRWDCDLIPSRTLNTT